ncbi:MAG: energy transducer TonB [Candidatus Sulfotelmatobacter sp.]
MSRTITATFWATLILAVTLTPILAKAQQTQNEEITRRAKSRVQPAFPELAKKMNISGIARIAVTVAPNGTVKEAHIVGGHPVLAGAALDAAKKWRFEPAPTETTGVIDFKFQQ